MTDYISKTDLLLALAELPQEASKREVLSVIYDMPVRRYGKNEQRQRAQG